MNQLRIALNRWFNKLMEQGTCLANVPCVPITATLVMSPVNYFLGKLCREKNIMKIHVVYLHYDNTFLTALFDFHIS